MIGIGIVGLPNVGKSTLFNAITKTQNAEAANYPFATIEPNIGMVSVPDSRLEELAKIINPQRTLGATVEFIDIAGLVKGASKGEGLGNQFLTNIRNTAAICQVVRCFDDPNIVHVEGSVDPIRDIETINAELIFADLDTVERAIQKNTKLARGGNNEARNDDPPQFLQMHRPHRPQSVPRFPPRLLRTRLQLVILLEPAGQNPGLGERFLRVVFRQRFPPFLLLHLLESQARFRYYPGRSCPSHHRSHLPRHRPPHPAR